jgi:hypothetical protein
MPAEALEAPVELRLELGAVIGLHDMHAKRQAADDLVDELHGRSLIAAVRDDRAVAFHSVRVYRAAAASDSPDVFPSERYGVATNERTVCVSSTDPSIATTSVQEAWQLAKKRGNVRCRLHDLRHTACTRMPEAGNSNNRCWIAAGMVRFDDGAHGEAVRTHRR